MFYKPGWLPMGDVARLVRNAAFHEREAKGDLHDLPYPELVSASYREAARFIGSLTQLKVLLGNGELLDASLSLIDGFGKLEDPGNSSVSAFVGTVGSGLEDYSEEYTERDAHLLRIIYGPFLGCPLLLNEAEVATAIEQRFGHSLPALRNLGAHASPAAIQAEEQRARGRGRPKQGNGSIEKAVQWWFARTYLPDEPRPKAEALVQEMIEWVHEVFGEDVSRTTMRRYLGMGSA